MKIGMGITGGFAVVSAAVVGVFVQAINTLADALASLIVVA